MRSQRHGTGHAAIRPLLVLFVVLALSGCGSGQDAGSESVGGQEEAVSADGETSDDSAETLTVTTAQADDQTAGDGSDDSEAADGESGNQDEGGEDVADIDPDEIELNPDAVNPPDKSTSTPEGTTPAAPTTEPSTTVGPLTSSTTKSASTAPPPADASYDSGLESLVQKAKDDLGSRLDVDPSTIAVHSAKMVTWPDASVGCSRPGMAYAQVLTDGSEIVLTSSQGAQYRYTSGGSLTAPKLCEA